MESSSDSKSSDMTGTAECGAYKPEVDDRPVPLTQAELNDLTRDLNLSKESAQLLGSHLREKHLLAPGTTFYWHPVELSAGLSLKSVTANFLGNHRSPQYQKVVDELMENFRQLGHACQ